MRGGRLCLGIGVALTAIAGWPTSAWSELQKPRQVNPAVLDTSGAQRAEIAIEAGRVTLRLAPRHLQGVTVPLSLRNALMVLENGRPRPDADIAVEHSPFTLAVLIENGGRSHQLNTAVIADAETLVRPLLAMLEPRDRLAVFAYDETLRTIVGFDSPHDQRAAGLSRLPKPRFSESNFCDAMLAALDQLAGVPGRKALLVLTTGIDTFSRATFGDVMARAEEVSAPVYVFNLGELARRRAVSASGGMLARLDWARTERQLARLAQVTGGGLYPRAGSTEPEMMYDEIVEALRVRYVLSYAPHINGTGRQTVQIAVVAPASNGRPAATQPSRGAPRVIAEANYMPPALTATIPGAGLGSER
jgi:Ca-activated chloride channel homolog